MKNKTYDLAYKLNTKLLNSINQRNLNCLNTNYGISSEMFEEIEDVINSVGIDLKKMGLKISRDKLRDIFEYDDGDYGIEADLVTIDGDRTDLTLITVLRKIENKYILNYRQIVVM